MGLAIGRTRLGIAAAEMKRARRWIAEGPAAHTLVDRVHGGEASAVESERLFLHHRQDWLVREIRRSRSCSRTRPAFPSRTAPTRQPQTMNLADDGVAADAAQGVCNLAGGQPLPPKGFQSFDTIIGPVSHGTVSTTGGREPLDLQPVAGSRAFLSLFQEVVRRAPHGRIHSNKVGSQELRDSAAGQCRRVVERRQREAAHSQERAKPAGPRAPGRPLSNAAAEVPPPT